MTPRDIFFNALKLKAQKNPLIYVLAVDFGCQALDDFKKEYPYRYINVGIAEQNAILVATGLALEGKRVFVYMICAFVARCYEQIKVDLCGMDLPVTIVGVGTEDEYKEAGPTHWAFEDLQALGDLPNMQIYDIKDTGQLPMVVDDCLDLPHPKYVRLRRTE